MLAQSQGSVDAVAHAAGEEDGDEDQEHGEEDEDPDYEPECQDWDAMSLDDERCRTHAQRSHARTHIHSLARKLTHIRAMPVHTAFLNHRQ